MHLHVSYKPNAIMGQNNQLQAIFCDLRERSLWYRDLSFPHLARVTSNTTNPIIETVNTWVEGIHPRCHRSWLRRTEISGHLEIP